MSTERDVLEREEFERKAKSLQLSIIEVLETDAALRARLSQADRNFQECFAAKESWKEAHDQVRAERDRYREALEEIAKETGTPYGRTARRALEADHE